MPGRNSSGDASLSLPAAAAAASQPVTSASPRCSSSCPRQCSSPSSERPCSPCVPPSSDADNGGADGPDEGGAGMAAARGGAAERKKAVRGATDWWPRWSPRPAGRPSLTPPVLPLLPPPLFLMLARLPSSGAKGTGREGGGKADDGGRGREGNWRSVHRRLPSGGVAAADEATCGDVAAVDEAPCGDVDS